MDLLQEFMPLPLVEASRSHGSLIGFVLLVLASGLYRRLDGAWLVTVSLLTAGIIVLLAKGFGLRGGISPCDGSGDYRTSQTSILSQVVAPQRPPSPLMLTLDHHCCCGDDPLLTFLTNADVPASSNTNG